MTDTYNPKPQAAKNYASLGWHVFPVWWIKPDGACACGMENCHNAGKHPIGHLAPKGQNDATDNINRVSQWWGRCPEANIGLNLARSGLAVVDVDPRNGGVETLDQIEFERGPFQTDLHQYSGGAGQHFFFLRPDDVAGIPGTLGPGIDMLLNKYVLLEPSNHTSGGSYEWEASSSPMDGNAPAPLPDWIRDLAVRSVQPTERHETGYRHADIDQLVDLREAIASIDFMDRDAWVRAGMALKELGQTGYEIWCSGFDRIGVYPKGSRDMLPIKWREFKPGSGLHYESVFGMAQSNGWNNPKAKHAHDDDDFVIDLSDIPSYREIDTSEEVIHIHGGLGIQDLDTIRPENIDWLWPGWIPRQMLIVIGGDPGCGKTMICCSIAACITNRVPFPDGYVLENPERVLMMTTEDDLKKTIAPRMYAAGVDPSMVSMLRYTMGNNNSPTPFNPKTDIPLIAKAFKERPFGLLILDSLADCISGDSNKNEDVRASLNVLSQMAEHCGFGVLGVLHQAKGSAGQKASMRLLGSVAFSGKPRSVISACKGENGADSVMVMSKTNITNPDKGFSYGMDSMDIVSRGDTIRDCFHIKWGEYFENGATAVLNAAEGVVAAPGPRADVNCKDAMDWIIESLQDGPVTCDDLNADAAMYGITLRTFERARAQLRKDGTIQSQRRFDNKVEWCLV